ncbi:echinoderm microtubule-associated protein-like 3 [Erinaceus europaeus]|uniref:Echinoderm microtubule-associated protein-like 3 n=1 Tax=Erinaceus europaeus TaxID=9365 RepID=A0ABM3YB81_ERIEU|nr:echinoderm microtubule-associated protein-like 3 [Erinaceus europaeus]
MRNSSGISRTSTHSPSVVSLPPPPRLQGSPTPCPRSRPAQWEAGTPARRSGRARRPDLGQPGKLTKAALEPGPPEPKRPPRGWEPGPDGASACRGLLRSGSGVSGAGGSGSRGLGALPAPARPPARSPAAAGWHHGLLHRALLAHLPLRAAAEQMLIHSLVVSGAQMNISQR